MEDTSKHIFEAIVKNDCRAIKEIAETDKNLDKSYKDYIIYEIERIEKQTDFTKKMRFTSELIKGIFHVLNNPEYGVQNKDTRA